MYRYGILNKNIGYPHIGFMKLKWITELASCIQLLKMGTMNHPFIQKGLWSRSRRAGQGTGRFAVACGLSTNVALIWKRSYNEMWAQLTPKKPIIQELDSLSTQQWLTIEESSSAILCSIQFFGDGNPMACPMFKGLIDQRLVVKAGGYRTANSPLAKSVLLLPAWTSWHGCFSFLMGLSMLR